MKKICSAVLVVVALASFAEPLKIQLPPETGSFKLAPGAELANGQCLMCHSVEYVTTQPVMPRPFWAASVKKMQDKYGAAIPAEHVDALVDYLTQNYGTNATPSTNVVANVVATEASAVAIKYGCLTCHSTKTKIVGPAYKEIADKYRNDSSAAAKVNEQIHKGGSGKWGTTIMPPFPQVSPTETKLLTDWILGQK